MLIIKVHFILCIALLIITLIDLVFFSLLEYFYSNGEDPMIKTDKKLNEENFRQAKSETLSLNIRGEISIL